MEDFKLLSLKDESQLSSDEQKRYYEHLRKYVLNRKLQVTTKGALTVAPKLKKFVDKIAGGLIPILAGGNIEIVVDGQEHIPEGAIIFANTHQGILDNFCWIPGVPKHCIILHASDVKKILIVAQLCTGLVLVSKKEQDIENRKNAKLDIMCALLKGHSIWYFPEGTWNLSPNKLHLPMSYGFLEIAKKTGAHVVPVVTEYTYDTFSEKERITKMHIRYGNPITVTMEDDLSEKLLEYSETISTIRWELIQEKGLFERRNITNWDYIHYLKGNFRNLEFGNKDLNLERIRIRGAREEYYMFHHINDVPFNEQGELLEPDEMRKLKLLERSLRKENVRNVFIQQRVVEYKQGGNF